MFDKRAIDLIKQQILKEVYSSYLYVVIILKIKV